MKKLFALLLITLFLSGCSVLRNKSSCPAYGESGGGLGRSYDRSTVSGWNYNGNVTKITGGTNADFISVEENDGIEKTREKRVVVYNANVILLVKNNDSLNASLSRIALKYNGYVLSLGTDRSTIRLKGNFLHEAIADISLLGKVRRKTVSGEDVTDDYQDSKVKLDNYQKARLRYLELLAKAENVEAALKVERELERLSREIDVLEGKIKRLDHLSEFSTITVYLDSEIRVQKPGILGYVGIGIYRGIKWLFVRG
jgi:hypothetical protein